MNPGRFSLLWELLSVFQGDPWPRQPLLAWKRLDLVIRSSSRAIPGLRSGFRSSELPEGSGLQDKFRAEFLCFPRVVVVVGFFFSLVLNFPYGDPEGFAGNWLRARARRCCLFKTPCALSAGYSIPGFLSSGTGGDSSPGIPESCFPSLGMLIFLC